MSSVSTAFKVHYNQKLGGPAILGGCTMAFGGIDAPDRQCVSWSKPTLSVDSVP